MAEKIDVKSKKKKLLLHSCCGPCSTSVLEKLREDYDICLFFYNPNITDMDEYNKRKENQLKVLSQPVNSDVTFFEGEYNPQEFFDVVKGLEDLKEGDARCNLCFRLRMKEAAKLAHRLEADEFSTTLSVSPHKNILVINEIGRELEKEFDIKFHDEDYKKKAGFQRSVELSKDYDIYRQNYCGCEFSKWEENK